MDTAKKEDNEWEFSQEKEEERKKAAFSDFLEAGQIAGGKAGLPHSHLIPSELLINSGETVEVAVPELEDNESGFLPTVMVHRDGQGVIQAVEMICSCGRKVRVDLGYDNNENLLNPEQESTNEIKT